MKIYCARCQLYLGQTDDGGIECQIICPICEDTAARIRSLISGDELETASYGPYMTWFGQVMHRSHEDMEAFVFIRLIHERRETDFFVFPTEECSR